MPLPENYSPWELLQSVVTRIQNRRVRDSFNDLGGDDWEPDISSSRGALRQACTIADVDTAPMVLIRLLLFYFLVENAERFKTPVYGIPITAFQASRKFKPQVVLFFQEDHQDVEPGYSPVTGEISFRIMNEESSTITQTKLKTIAQKIKTLFMTGSGFIWKKGKVMCSYTDKEKGYQMVLYCRNKTEGRRVIEQVLDIQGHTPKWSKMNVRENEEPATAYPTIPANINVMGQTQKEPRSLPIADVRFQYAISHIWGRRNPVYLADNAGIFRTAYEKSY